MQSIKRQSCWPQSLQMWFWKLIRWPHLLHLVAAWTRACRQQVGFSRETWQLLPEFILIVIDYSANSQKRSPFGDGNRDSEQIQNVRVHGLFPKAKWPRVHLQTPSGKAPPLPLPFSPDMIAFESWICWMRVKSTVLCGVHLPPISHNTVPLWSSGFQVKFMIKPTAAKRKTRIQFT